MSGPRPILKWVGGKTRLLDDLLARSPATFRRYFEPFAGGAALFFELSPRDAVIGDANEDLVNVYRCVARNVAGVISVLEDHESCHSREHYYATRAKFNERPASMHGVDRAAAFIYLNKTCFNGLWRVNRRGEFNVPMGRYARPVICDREGLMAASSALAGADIRCGDAADTVADAGPGDFVYLDPPYCPATKTADFVGYVAGGFGEVEQRRLATLMRELQDRGCYVLASNSDTPLTRDIYREMPMDSVQCGRSINSKGDRRGAVGEVIIRPQPNDVPASERPQLPLFRGTA